MNRSRDQIPPGAAPSVSQDPCHQVYGSSQEYTGKRGSSQSEHLTSGGGGPGTGWESGRNTTKVCRRLYTSSVSACRDLPLTPTQPRGTFLGSDTDVLCYSSSKTGSECSPPSGHRPHPGTEDVRPWGRGELLSNTRFSRAR